MNIYQAINFIMQKGYAVGKDRKNEQQRFFYRGIDDVMNVFQPLMAEAGIFIVPEVLEAKREDRQTAKGGNLIYSVLKILGIVVDPTTEGVHDSERAMTYEEPWVDEETK